MEERAWELVEKFISGEATARELRLLRDLLIKDTELQASVREFLETYVDPEPRITETDKSALMKGIRRPQD